MKAKRLLGILLTVVLVLGLMPWMGLTSHAATLKPTVEPANAGLVDFEDDTSSENPAWKYTATATAESGYVFDHWEWIYNGNTNTDSENPISLGKDISIEDVKAVFRIDYPLWVAGTQVTSLNASNVLNDEKSSVSYNASSNALMLNGFTYAACGVAIEYKGTDELKIFMNGSNIIVTTGDYGIKANNAGLDFLGKGSLSVSCSKENSKAIYSANDIFISSGNLDVEAKKNGIYTNGGIFVKGGNVKAKGEVGIYSYGINKVKISGGTVTAEGKGDNGVGVSLSGGELTIMGTGKLQAQGDKVGILCEGGKIFINEGEVSAIGKVQAIDGAVINKILGAGWTDTEGNRAKNFIPISEEIKNLKYKKVQFPVEKDPVTLSNYPEAKTLNYTGSAQELVTAGTAYGGTIQYALGTATEATEPYNEAIPTATDAGTYYIWYKAIADENHIDGDSYCVTSKIRADISKTVTFKVVNGSWDDGENKDKVVKIEGFEGDMIKLSADKIPAVGTKPSDGYKEGAWDIIPDTNTEITKDITYTYTYEKLETHTDEKQENPKPASQETHTDEKQENPKPASQETHTDEKQETTKPTTQDTYTNAGSGVGKVTSDGKKLVDTDNKTWYMSDKINNKDLKKNLKVAVKNGGKYKITKVTKKGGKVTGGTVTYMAPYDKNCKLISATGIVKLGGVKFKVTQIAPNCAKGCKNLKKVVIGSYVTTIGDKAFYNCKKLNRVSINGLKLKKVGSNAFKNTNSKIVFKCPKSKLKNYEKLFTKAGASKKAKYTK